MTTFEDCEFYSTEEDGDPEHEHPHDAIIAHFLAVSLSGDELVRFMEDECPLDVFGFVETGCGLPIECTTAASRRFTADECLAILRKYEPELFT